MNAKDRFYEKKWGAGYYVITVMQGTRYMLAPNSAFESENNPEIRTDFRRI